MQHRIQQSNRMLVMTIHTDIMIIHTLIFMHGRNCIVVSITILNPVIIMFTPIDMIIFAPVNTMSNTCTVNWTMWIIELVMSLISHFMNSATNARIVKTFATRVIPRRHEKPIISGFVSKILNSSRQHMVLPFPASWDFIEAGCTRRVGKSIRGNYWHDCKLSSPFLCRSSNLFTT